MLSSYLTDLVVVHLICVLNCKMGSTTHEIKDSDARPDRPKITPQDEIVSSYLENRSEVFRDLVKVQSDVSDV